MNGDGLGVENRSDQGNVLAFPFYNYGIYRIFMTDLLSHLAQRRSVKPLDMHGPGPTAEQIQMILTLAARVPDHGKLAPWRFILFEGEARPRAGVAIAQVFARLHPEADQKRIDLEMNRFSQAPLVIGVISTAAEHVKIPVWEQILSAGAVCMNLTIAATAMGFRTAWLTDWFAYQPDALEALGVHSFEKVAGFIHIGRSELVPEDRIRPQISEKITYF